MAGNIDTAAELIRDSLRYNQLTHAGEMASGNNFPVDRAFYTKSGPPGHEQPAVLSGLPTFEEKSCEDWIQAKIDSNQSKTPIKILDIGCGTGRALADIEQKHQGKTEGWGLTLFPYQPQKLPGEKIIIGDLSRLNSIFGQQHFDIIYTYQTLLWAGRPVMNLIPKIWRALAPKGIAFLANVGGYPRVDVERFDKLTQWFKEQNLNFEFQTKEDDRNLTEIIECSFQKTTELPLLLPLKYKHEAGSMIKAVFDTSHA